MYDECITIDCPTNWDDLESDGETNYQLAPEVGTGLNLVVIDDDSSG